MKARPKKPSARSTASKPAVAGKRTAPARKAKSTAKPVKHAKASASRSSRTALGAECTIEHAPGLQKQLAQVLADRACVTLDFSAVKRCDTAGMQVLAAFLRERREAGREVELASMSGHFRATAKLLGLSALFEPAGSGA
ncbi:MAG: STAS domain-containing protein [Gammaproteobacteria bacterium]